MQNRSSRHNGKCSGSPKAAGFRHLNAEPRPLSRRISGFLKTRAIGFAYVAWATLALVFYPRIWPTAPNVAPDSYQYLEAARTLREWPATTPTERTPGYPAFLLLLRQIPPGRLLFHAQLLLHFLAAYLVISAGRKAGLRLNLALLALVILAAPSELQSAARVLSEAVAEVTLAAGFWSLIRYFEGGKKIMLALSSISLAYGALTRPAITPVMLFGVTALALARPLLGLQSAVPGAMLRFAVAASTVPLLTMTAYAGMNWLTAGYFGVTPRLPVHLGTKTADFWEQIADVRVRNVLLRKREEMRAAGQNFRWAGEDRQPLMAATGMDSVGLARHMTALHLDLIRRNPLRYLKTVWESGFEILMPYRYWCDVLGPHSKLLYAFWEVFYFASIGWSLLVSVILLGVAALRGLLGSRTNSPLRQDLQHLMACLVLALTFFWGVALLSCALDIGEPRHKAPVEIFRWLACGLGLEAIWRFRATLRTAVVSWRGVETERLDAQASGL